MTQYKISDRVEIRHGTDNDLWSAGSVVENDGTETPYKVRLDEGGELWGISSDLRPLLAVEPEQETDAPVYKVGQEVEALIPFSLRWHTATIVEPRFPEGIASVCFDGSESHTLRSFDQIRPLPATPLSKENNKVTTGNAITPATPSIDPEELRLMRQMCEFALRLNTKKFLREDFPKLSMAIEALAEYRTPKPARCEPPDEFKGERWHWLYREGVYAPWCWSMCANGWRWSKDDVATPLKGAEAVAADGWTYHSVARPAPVWSDAELKDLYLRWHGNVDMPFTDLARALLSGDKSLIEGK